MNKNQAVRKICEAIGKKFDDDFPCICGHNILGTNLNLSDQAKLDLVIDAINKIDTDKE